MSKPQIAPRATIAPSPAAVSPEAVRPDFLAAAISTSKEWVLPPRPKPGRKPSVDTPASKRKAQNRAAQRAFRERRATRVQELEQKLMEVEKEKEVKEMGLINTINKLKIENSFLAKNVDALKNEVAFLRAKTGHADAVSAVSPSSSTYSVQQIAPAPSTDSPPRRAGLDCGVCLKDSCVCEEVGIREKDLEETLSQFKPMQAVSLKRKASEIDFTARFSKRPLPEFKKKEEKVTFDEDSPVDNCGFCSDDTPCVCREAAQEAARLNTSLQTQSDVAEHEDKTLPPIQLNSNSFRKTSLPVMHPGPSVEIRDITNLTPGAVPTVVTPTTRNNTNKESTPKPAGCTGNPGTCEQCQTDPMATLFCTTVASRAKTGSETSSDTASAGASGASIESPDEPEIKTEPTPQPLTPAANGMFIPCADAYKTLSRHKKFSSVDFSTLVGKLTTRGMQVEVQSVANVLRELDRRLYN